MKKVQIFQILLFVSLISYRAEQWYFMARVVQPAHVISAASIVHRNLTYKNVAGAYRMSASTHVDRPEISFATLLLPIDQPHELIAWNISENLTPGLVDNRKPLDALLN